MVGPSDYIWITLLPPRLEWVHEVGEARNQNAIDEHRRPKNNAPTNPALARVLNHIGLPGECVGMIYLSPCTWNYFKRGDLTGLPDLSIDGIDIDVKTRQHAHHRLIVQLDDPLEWAYVLACRAQFPRMCLVGWCWGRDAQRPQYRGDPVGGRPAFGIAASDPIWQPMILLRHFCHGPGAR